jgi:hypothetical protein
MTKSDFQSQFSKSKINGILFIFFHLRDQFLLKNFKLQILNRFIPKMMTNFLPLSSPKSKFFP